jgi:hypothetical protein
MEDSDRLISPETLAERWDISLSAVRQRKAGTKQLLRIRIGRQIRFRLSDVIALENKLFNRAIKLMKPVADLRIER